MTVSLRLLQLCDIFNKALTKVKDVVYGSLIANNGATKGNEMSTIGILLPCDGGEPEPVSVGDYQHIQQIVGGHFDAVRMDIDAQEFGEDADTDGFAMVGYVHDEGLLIGLPYNSIASMLFGRDLVGPCVVVSGTSPNGFYDGDNHDVPEWFNRHIFSGALQAINESIRDISDIGSKALALAFVEGVFNAEAMERIMDAMDNHSPEGDELVAKSVALAIGYASLRADGMMPYNEFKRTLKLSDEEIAEFFNNINEEEEGE